MNWKSEFTIFALIVLCNVVVVGGKWCTRQKSDHIQHQVTVMEKCNQTYETACSFFSWDKCIFTEVVDCPVKKNITVTTYVTEDVCCRGFKLDPINNVTCIPTSAESVKSPPKPPKPPKEWQKQSVTVSGVEKGQVVGGTESENNEVPTSTSNGDDENGDESTQSPPHQLYSPKPLVTLSGAEKDGIVVVNGAEKNEGDNNISVSPALGYSDDGNEGDEGHIGNLIDAAEEEEDLLFGLSYGAYAGIICSLLFIFCVFVLIMLRVRKRARKNMAKGNDANSMGMETTQQMLSVPA